VADRPSTVEVLIPAFQQVLLVLLDDRLDPVDFPAGESLASLQPDGIKPKLGLTIIALDVNVRWLIPIAGIQEEAVGARCEGPLASFENNTMIR
jgi:hypothetical protein